MNLRRESLYRIFVGIPIPLIILTIPVIAHLLTKPSYFFALSITTAADLALIITLIVRGILLRQYSRFGAGCGKIMLRSGFLNSRSSKIKLGAVTFFELHRSVFSAVFGVSKLEIQTVGSTEASIYLSKASTGEFKKMFEFASFSHAHTKYKATHLQIFLMSITGSNAVTGLLILVPVVRTAIVDIFDELSTTAMEILPFRSRILTAVTVLFFLGWVVSSADKFIRFHSFKTWKNNDYIFTSGGLFFRYLRRLELKKIYAVDIRETLFSMILRRSSVYLLAPGRCGNRAGKLVLLPSAGLNELNRTLRNFFPYSNEVVCTLSTPHKMRLSHFAAAFNTLCAALLVGPKLSQAFLPAVILVSGVCLWSLAISFFEMKRSGIKICTDCIVICARRFFTLHTQKISREKIDAVTITRNPFQRYSGLCSVTIKIKGVRTPLKCRHLPFERTYAATARL